MIVQSLEPITLVGGGPSDSGDLELALARAPRIVAADGGAKAVLAAGAMPEAVIGDFDSLSEVDKAKIPPERLFRVHDQDRTDFDKALHNIDAPLVLGVGFLGGRIDHQLAAFNTLLSFPDKPCILIGPLEIVFHVPRQMDLDLHAGDVVSLFPMIPVSGRSTGLQWPIDGLHLVPGGRIGTSNAATGPIRLEMDGPGALGVVPRTALDAVMRAIALS